MRIGDIALGKMAGAYWIVEVLSAAVPMQVRRSATTDDQDEARHTVVTMAADRRVNAWLLDGDAVVDVPVARYRKSV